MAAHSSVNYVEPNITSVGGEYSGGTFGSWKFDDDVERAPRLEDYSIAVNLEVEVCSRNNISQSKTITSDVLVLSYKTNINDGTSVVNFMGGTKIKTGNDDYRPIQYLTTNYADMYVGDLIDYGTTEMIGIKSIDVEYLKSCVPIITIKFTDVRGLSLFQPTELSRTNSYQGIGGINADNVAQSFFQCFFRVPMPKFTITIKGFYGKPVTYEVMCDKFDTVFNSKTGDFDITTRFIGYSYSFLTDISIDALLAAPYSDYHGGKDYWDEQKNDRFTIWNKEKTVKRPMPTLFEIWQEMKSILKENVDVESSLTDEEKNHSEEIAELTALQGKFRIWYETLFNILTTIYGKDYCYLFKEDGEDGEYYRILILANNATVKNSTGNLSHEYESFPDSFKQINKDLYAAIETYNSKGNSYKKLDNISQDFSKYVVSDLFNNTFINAKNDVVFNGFSKRCVLPKTQVIKNVFYGAQYTGNTNEEIASKETQHKKHVLETIYGNGTDQYVKCYSIEVEYRSIRNRLNALQADANANLREKEHKKKIKALNKAMFEKMSWYPSVENFTKIMMAHLETLMRMMYNVIDKCDGRTAKQLGVGGNCSDVNNKAENDVIPPFPRVTKNVLGDDGITKIEDAWVGEYDQGEIPFEEVDFIDGLFNAVERLEALKKDSEAAEAERNRETNVETNKPLIKHPVSSFDFYLTNSPYGNSSDISNDIKGFEFAGKVAIRMFNILSLSNFRKEFASKIIEGDLLNKIARIEADNFHDTVKITNDKLITMIRDKVITPDTILSIITTSNTDTDCPWGKRLLFDNSEENMWLNGYHVKNEGYENNLYPIQGYSFSKNEEYFNALNSKKISNYDGTMSVWNVPTEIKDSALMNDKCGIGNLVILNDFDSVKNQLDSANSSSDSGYTDYYNIIQSACTFDDDTYNSFIKVEKTVPSICNTLNIENISSFEFEGNNIKASDHVYSNSNVTTFASEAKQKTFTNYTITEIFPYLLVDSYDVSKGYKLDLDSSLKMKDSPSNVRDNAGGNKLTLNDRRTTALIMGIKLNTNSLGNYLKKSKTVSYVPRLAALQIGAILFASGGIHSERGENMRVISKKYLPVGDVTEYAPIFFQYINELSKPAKVAYIKYYLDWCKSHTQFSSRLIGDNGTENDKHFIFAKEGLSTFRRLLKETDELVKEMTSELLSPVAIVNLSINSKIKKHLTMSKYALNKSKAKAYLEAFIGRLEEIYKINYAEDSSGNLIKTTDEPRKTTEDMKAELYRYMKQIYDKWLPMSSFDEWQLDSFFIDESGEEQGHKFYFIDSYYNEIGHKLLLNPKIISEKVDALLNYRDVNAMMLGFMADIYGANKCMLMSIQNFADLKKEHSMDEMFTTVPYNSIDWSSLNKYPSFVVVYPYEPSKNLDIPNNEYNNDGFMLNDEFETPEAIRTKSDVEGQYRIPAFGVSYGKQYQSYFKSVNVDMKSPIATQQSIKAKHFIIREQASTKEKGVASQDLYDVYSTQSYNCSVEMMGCAWVQPLMYFVLLNVPMFRGSYMIMKVKHSIKPGDMTTTFTGCRMANVSNKLIEDIFTDEDFLGDDSSFSAYESERELKADISNDCPYKIYPLYGDSTIDLNGDAEKNGVAIITKLTAEPLKFNEWAAAGIAGNMLHESGFIYDSVVQDNSKKDKGVSGGLCMWRNGLLIDLVNKKTTKLGHNTEIINPTDEALKSYSKKLNQIGPDYQLDYLKMTMTTGNGNYVPLSFDNYNKIGERTKSANSCAIEFQKLYENPAKIDSERGNSADKLYKAWKRENNTQSSQPTNADPNNKKDIATAFFEAVDKSAQYTPSIGVKLKNLGIKDGYLRINQNNGKTDKLGVVFDMILNSEYYDNIQELGYVYPNGGLETDLPPDVIYCKVAEKVDGTKKRVWAVKFGDKPNNANNEIPTTGDSVNHNLLKSLGKKYAKLGEEKFHKEVPQVNDVKTLDSYKPEDCNSLLSSGGYPSGPGSNSTWAKAVQSMGKWYQANVHTYQSNTPPSKGSGSRRMYNCSVGDWKGKVADDCSGFVSACLQYFGAFKSGFIPSSAGFTKGSDVASALSSKGFTKLAYSWDAVQPYDIISYNNGKSGHVEILAEKASSPKSWGWGSVHDGQTYGGKTRDIMPAKTGDKPKGTTYTTIWRYTT